MTIGSRIQSARKEAGLTQQAIASKLGVTPQAVSQWESGTTTPDVERIRQIADTLHSDMAWLLDGQRRANGAANGASSVGAASTAKHKLTPQQAVDFARACMVALEEMADESLANRFLEALLTDVQERGDAEEYRDLQTLRAKVRTILRLADAGLLSRHPRSP